MKKNPTPSIRAPRRLSKGQITVIFAAALPVIVLFVSLAVDMTLIYLTKAKLSRAADATALRVARKFQADADRRREIALRMMQSNFPGFLEGITDDVAYWTVIGNVTTSGGENQKVRAGEDYMEIQTEASSAQGAITAEVIAQTTHSTFFMKLLGKNFEQFTFEERATATRFPAVNVLILDLSGSMLGNGGASGLVDGVKDFVREFDEDRDYMLVIGYNNKGSILWPNVDFDYGDTHTETVGGRSYGIATGVDSIVGPIDGLHYYKPSRNFKRGLDSAGFGTTALNIETAIDNTGFAEYTCASEGLRLGAEMLHKWLENDVDESIRDQLQINFIFFTDGEFNTIRSYIRGPGFGSNKTNKGDVDTPSRLSVHNTFHDYDPIVARDLNVTFEGKNLSTIFGSYAHPVDVPGVNSCFNMGDLSSSGSNWQWLPKGTNSEASDTSSRWRGQLIFPFRSVAYREDDLTGNWQSKIPRWHRMPGDEDDQWQGMGYLLAASLDSSNYSYSFVEDDSGRPNTSYGNLSRAMIEAERSRCERMERTYFPVSVTNQWVNPISGVQFFNSHVYDDSSNQIEGIDAGRLTRNGRTYYYLPDAFYDYYGANSSERYTDAEYSYDPCGRLWTNHYGSYYRYSSGSSYAIRKSKLPWIYEKTSGSNRTGWVVGTSRLCDFYLDYTMGGQPHFNGDATDNYWGSNQTRRDRNIRILGDPDWAQGGSGSSSNSSRGNGDLSNSEDNFHENDSDHRPRVRKWWRFSNSSWTTSSGVIDDEGYWMSRAQAFVLKDQFNASFYTIVYGNNGNATQMKLIANDPSYQNQYDPTQPDGKFYKTSESSQELTDVFRDIASRIAVKLTD
jgi:hypothetical protein